MHVLFLQSHYPYQPGQKVFAGKGHNLGTGVAKLLQQRRIVQLIPDEPAETEPRPPRKTKRAG